MVAFGRYDYSDLYVKLTRPKTLPQLIILQDFDTKKFLAAANNIGIERQEELYNLQVVEYKHSKKFIAANPIFARKYGIELPPYPTKPASLSSQQGGAEEEEEDEESQQQRLADSSTHPYSDEILQSMPIQRPEEQLSSSTQIRLHPPGPVRQRLLGESAEDFSKRINALGLGSRARATIQNNDDEFSPSPLFDSDDFDDDNGFAS